jgi:ATP-dependent exoDNAse (exonuclease V) alpha subunit
MKQTTAMEILKTGRNVFLTGSAGTGKTFLLNEYIEYLKNRKISPVVLAPTGIAASHINGMTIHSFFGLGVKEKVNDGLARFLISQKFVKNRLKKLEVLVIDEVSMISPDLFETIDKILRKFKETEIPFGGVQVVLSGDFFQLPPISKNLREEKFIWQASLWESADFKICYLEEKFRHDDNDLIRILDEIRSGVVSSDSMELFESCYNREFPNGLKVTRLYTHNADVDRINEQELNRLKGRMVSFDSKGEGAKKHQERIFKTSLVTPKLKLKIGALVIFVKKNYELGYINGTLGKVVGFDSYGNGPIVEILSGRKILVKRERWEVENDKGEVTATVRQIPLRLAWALTVHKSQGMTLDGAEIDLSKTFEIGQGYVALSRVRSIKGLRLLGLNDIALMVDKNVLERDKEIKKASDLIRRKVESFSDEEKNKMFKEFLLSKGGIIDEEKIEEQKRELKKEAKKKFEKPRKENTLELTRKLVQKGKSLEEIIKKRGLAEDTIIKHLDKIKKKYPKLDFSNLKPEEEIVKSVKKAVLEIKKRKNKEDFLINNKVKLRSIFEYLEEEISYKEIKLALIFGEIKC